ncbi:MAG: hypothetical protein ACOVKV_17270, partial [Novosphingobium sp.]
MQFTPVRTAIILFVALFGILFAVPNFLSKDQLAGWPDFLPKQPMVLGLDLQGGSHIMLEIDQPDLVRSMVTGLRDDVRRILREASVSPEGGIRVINRGVELRIPDAAARAK